MPMSLFRRRTEIGCAAAAFFVMFNLTIVIYYLPYYYQASRGRSPMQSGIDILPFMSSIVLTATAAGAVINLTGRYCMHGTVIFISFDADLGRRRLVPAFRPALDDNWRWFTVHHWYACSPA